MAEFNDWFYDRHPWGVSGNWKHEMAAAYHEGFNHAAKAWKESNEKRNNSLAQKFALLSVEYVQAMHSRSESEDPAFVSQKSLEMQRTRLELDRLREQIKTAL